MFQGFKLESDEIGLMIFKKCVHDALWGSENWEISAHPSDPSVIADGKEKGRRLNEIYPNFPLLFKVIDAKTRLSVQVHPNEETCKVTGGEPKTEMWCALSNGPIYAVQRRGIVEPSSGKVAFAARLPRRCRICSGE